MGGSKRKKRRLTLTCGLPQDVLEGAARVTLFGSASAMIEGQQGVVELGGSCMRLRTRSGVLTVLGEGMTLREMTADAAMIEGGRIDTVSYGGSGRREKGGAPCG